MRDGRPAIQLVLERACDLGDPVPAFFLKIAIGVPAGTMQHPAFLRRSAPMLLRRGFTMRLRAGAAAGPGLFGAAWLAAEQASEGMTNAILPIVTLARGSGDPGALHPLGHAGVLGQPYIRAASAKGLSWRRVVTEHARPMRHPDHHHHRLHGRHPDRGCRGGRKRIRLARHRAPAGRLGRQPRSRRRADHLLLVAATW